MFRTPRSLLLTAAALATPLTLAGCPSDPAPVDAATSDDAATDASTPTDAPAVACFDDLETAETLELPNLDGPLEVVYDDRGIPHIYGTTVHDVIEAQAYLMARDRYGQMDFIRRNVLGRLAEIAGALDSSLVDTDYDNRVRGFARMGRAIYESLPATSRSRIAAEAFAEGVNAYIAAYDEDLEDPRVEGGDLISLLLTRTVDRTWRPEDIFAMARFQSDSLSFDAGADIDRTELLAAIDAEFGDPADPRHAMYRDLFDDLPARHVYARDGFNDGSTMASPRPGDVGNTAGPRMQLPSLAALRGALPFFERGEQMRQSLGFGDESRGSNNWVVAASLTANDNPILSNDPHLSLISPGVWWYAHINTARMGGEDAIDAEGVAFAGLPGIILGFNQNIAWGATTTGYDVTDVYLEQITEGEGDAPDTVAFDTDGDGSLEQVPIVVQEESFVVQGQAEPVVRTIEYVTTHGTGLSPISPGSRVAVDATHSTALSIRYTGYEISDELAYFAGLWTASDVSEAATVQDNFRVGSQNFVVVDRSSIRWSSESRVPERPDAATNLAYASDGTMSGYCPIFVLPGQGEHEWTGDLSSSFVPHDQNPARGWIATANQDNVGVTDDGNPCNDAHYLGGDFDLGWREWRIQSDLGELAARGGITTEDMMHVQAESRSALGSTLRDAIVAVLESPSDLIPTLTSAELADLEMVRTRLAAWSLETPEATTSTDASVIADSVATSIFNALITRLGPIALADEAAAVGRSGFSSSRVARFLENSFTGTPEQQAQLAVYWDDLTTTEITELKEPSVIQAALSGLAFLRTRIGTEEDGWRWGLLHTVRFQTVLPTTGTDILSIPRTDDTTYPNGFPRHGDFGSVDPGQYGLWNTTSFAFGSGASQRLVVEMTETGPIAFNSLPGGQSIDPNSPHKQDEALLWMRNEQPRLAFQADEVRTAADRCLRIVPAD